MAEFKVELLTNYREIEPVYNDFRTRAATDYNFELEPLNFDDFVDAIKKDLIKCLVLKEDGIPVAFLVYTTMISEAIELNMVHCLNMENYSQRSQFLFEQFLKETKDMRLKKIVCYPMLGKQKELINDIAHFGFKFVSIAVLRFLMTGTNSQEIFKMTKIKDIPQGYTVVQWDNKYFNCAIKVIKEAFEMSADALFDPRFKTLEGTDDILTKITKNIYAEFLPEATSVLLFENNPVGFCFMNITDNKIVNIPIVGIKKEHQGKGLSKMLLKFAMDRILYQVQSSKRPITEINTCTETNNFQALKMYRNLGFKEDYNYPQSYLPITKN